MSNWTKRQTAKLIKLYRQEPMLYNICDPSYLNKKKKEECYKLIFEKMIKSKRDTSIHDIKCKLKTLKIQFNKEKSLVIKSKESGSGSDEIYVPKLWCYDDLIFWDNYTDELNDLSNINLIQCTESSSTDDGDYVDLSEYSIIDSEMQCDDRTLSLRQKIDEFSELAKQYIADISDNNDKSQVGALAKMLICDLKGVSKDVFLQAKWKILDVLKEAVEKQIEIDKTKEIDSNNSNANVYLQNGTNSTTKNPK